MALPDDWDRSDTDRGWGVAGTGIGALQIAVLFGSAAVAFALILTPLVVSHTSRIALSPAGIDSMSTGSIGNQASGTYTVRRSVLQSTPNSVCIIRQNGTRSGDC